MSTQLVFGRPINDAYMFCFIAGVSLVVCTGTTVMTIRRERVPKRFSSLLQYLTNFFSLLFIVINLTVLMSPWGCPAAILSSLSYTATDLSADTFLLLVAFLMIKQDEWEKRIKMIWVILYLIGEIGSRVIQYVSIHEIYI